MKKLGVVFCWIFFLFSPPLVVAETCEVTIKNKDGVGFKWLESTGVPLFKSYVTPVEFFPQKGEEEDRCHYSLLVRRTNAMWTAVIGGDAHQFGYSNIGGDEGATQALLSAIYQMIDEKTLKEKMCKAHPKLIQKECQGKRISLKYRGRMAHRTRQEATGETVKQTPPTPGDPKILRLSNKMEKRIGLLLGTGRYDQVLRLVEETLESIPHHPVLYFLKGVAQTELGEDEAAQLDFSKACDLGLKKACLRLEEDL